MQTYSFDISSSDISVICAMTSFDIPLDFIFLAISILFFVMPSSIPVILALIISVL